MMLKLNRSRLMMSKQHSEASNGKAHNSSVVICIELIS